MPLFPNLNGNHRNKLSFKQRDFFYLQTILLFLHNDATNIEYYSGIIMKKKNRLQEKKKSHLYTIYSDCVY